jgi:hypothetical protein
MCGKRLEARGRRFTEDQDVRIASCCGREYEIDPDGVEKKEELMVWRPWRRLEEQTGVP